MIRGWTLSIVIERVRATDLENWTISFGKDQGRRSACKQLKNSINHQLYLLVLPVALPGALRRSLISSTLGRSAAIDTFFFCSPLPLPALFRIESRRTKVVGELDLLDVGYSALLLELPTKIESTEGTGGGE